MNLPKLIIMVGLPGSGKSTRARELAVTENCIVLSSDSIRKELSGSEQDQTQNDKVFKLLYQRMNDLLSKGESVIVDATNTTIKSRKRILSECRCPCYKEVQLVATPVDECASRDRFRERSVGVEVIKKFEQSFQCPQYFEGFDSILCKEWEDSNLWPIANYLVEDLTTRMNNFHQYNFHHLYTVGEHCARQSRLISDYCKSHKQFRGWQKKAEVAGRFHDVGKLFTQHFDENGVAHYYNHDSVGTYFLASHPEILCCVWEEDLKKIDLLDMLFLINFHMRAHNDFQSSKAQKKYRALFGDERFDLLMAFGECDRAATGTDFRSSKT